MMIRLTTWLQAEAPDAELQGVHAMKVTARAEARPRLVLLTHADVDILQRQIHALRGQGQQPVLQLCQHALRRSGCTLRTMSVSLRSILPLHGEAISCGVQSREKRPHLITEDPWPGQDESLLKNTPVHFAWYMLVQRMPAGSAVAHHWSFERHPAAARSLSATVGDPLLPALLL